MTETSRTHQLTLLQTLWREDYLPPDWLLLVQLDKLVHVAGVQRQEAERADRQRDVSLLPDALQHLLQSQVIDLTLPHLLPHVLANQSTAACHRSAKVTFIVSIQHKKL